MSNSKQVEWSDKMKKFFMNLGGSQPEPEQKQEKTSKIAEWAKDEIKDELKDEALEAFFENVKLLDVSGGVATIAIPLTALQLITTMFQSITKQLENEQEIER